MNAQAVVELGGPLTAVSIVAARSPGDADAAQAPQNAPTQTEQMVRQAAARLEEERTRTALANQALRAAAEQILSLEQRILEESESHLVDLALAIAEKVVAQEIEEGRIRIEPIVREALKQAPPRRDIAVHLNPQDLAVWQESVGDEGEMLPPAIRLLADESVKRGECIVESAEGTVSATITERLSEARELLKTADQV